MFTYIFMYIIITSITIIVIIYARFLFTRGVYILPLNI